MMSKFEANPPRPNLAEVVVAEALHHQKAGLEAVAVAAAAAALLLPSRLYLLAAPLQ